LYSATSPHFVLAFPDLSEYPEVELAKRYLLPGRNFWPAMRPILRQHVMVERIPTGKVHQNQKYLIEKVWPDSR